MTLVRGDFDGDVWDLVILSVLGKSRFSPSWSAGTKTVWFLSFVGPKGTTIGGGLRLPEGSFIRWELEVI